MPPEQRIAAFLARARTRIAIIESALAAAVVCLAGAAWMFLRGWTGASRFEVAVTAAGLAIAIALVAAARIRRRTASSVVETRTPHFHNTLVTAEQLLRGEIAVKPGIRDLVLHDTAARTAGASLATLLPARVPVAMATLAAIACGGAMVFALSRGAAPETATAEVASPSAVNAGAGDVEVHVTPPAYTGLQQQRTSNPDRIEAVEGSRIVLRLNGTPQPAVVATDQTYLAAAEGRVLIPLSITPDRSPVVRITDPAGDLFLPPGARDIPVRVTATDDFGLISLALAYTKVSGSGETFSFVEGTLPLAISKADGTSWSATATIRTAALGLSEGDTLVYRAVARDAHPSRGAAESDALVVEIVSASEASAEGFSIDDQRDKYALSQQMVILKTERLIASRRSMTPEQIIETAAMIGAEQRQVRAEFVFMMGGEVEDEEVEAEHAHELEEGREQNEGRRDLLAAIRSMSDAAALLMRPDVDQALVLEKRALASLQRALVRSRYILRVFAPRERIDDARRLTGDRADAASWSREPRTVPPSPAAGALRGALLRLSLHARASSSDDVAAGAFTGIAQPLLPFLSASRALQTAVEQLAKAERARRGDTQAIARALDEAALAIDAALEAEARASAAPLPGAVVSGRVRSALADQLRAGGGR